MWYEVKVKYSKIDDNERIKTFNQPYLFDALTFTEAEARATEEMGKYLSEGFKITNIKVANFSELFPNENGDRWFKCKVSLVTLDEDKGLERRTNTYVLVQANDVKDAYDYLTEQFADTVSDYSIPSITESPIIDIFPFFDGDEEPTVAATPQTYTEDSFSEDENIDDEALEEEFTEEEEEEEPIED
ncbi:DUF4494 domain-containing protein [Wenyingzhuangia sp. chi5]|uniref:DUF4494 domain-containing protein n=1 Tax=Wenyingzhuangia gilva TaxID=3057677 RepID=A0ABT8VSX7_9FLAO|nr:DUF4494 domain-containing protein [Wenyingzhuangia sp. chi5]MDO3695035.1 DUF4494 domain-containing protein [Wenyingzhuangia sp. chi5]